MIYKEYLEEFAPLANEATQEIFEAAWNNQTHPQDLLLVILHGFFDKLLANNTHHGLSPYMIVGWPGTSVLSLTHIFLEE